MMNPNHENSEYDVSLDLPYPAAQTKCRRSDYAYAMLSNVGSSNSEICAVSLYFYNSVILHPEYADIARCFHQISIIEMHHLDIFATLAYQMGLDPRLWSMKNQSRCYWTPAYNQYPREICSVIENSIKSEEAAVHKYKRQAETIADPDIVEILHRIILDEEHHIKIFHTMLHSLKA